MLTPPPLDPHQATTLESDIDLRGVPTDGDLLVIVIERVFVVNAFAGTEPSSPCPHTIKLLRSPEGDAEQRENWFLLYVAEYRNLVVEATVRMALKRMDFSASHLELIDILNFQELKAEMKDIARKLILGSC